MTSPATKDGNAIMVDRQQVQAWLEIRDPLESQLEPLGRAAMEALALSAGQRVLDVGCGVGGTPFALAERVGPSGHVVGLELLQAAAEVMRRDGRAANNVTFFSGDAQTYPFEPRSFDAIFSRFGLMFFEDAVSAFRNLSAALRSGGRLGFVCWRSLADNELDYLPLNAAAPHLPPDLVSQASASPCFSFSNPGKIHQVLTEAGFADIAVAPRDALVGSGSLGAMVDVCSRVGALGAILRRHPQLRRHAVPALQRALAARDSPTGPALRAATWIVTARAEG